MEVFFFFKQKTAYEMRIRDWSSDVCSSDLRDNGRPTTPGPPNAQPPHRPARRGQRLREAAAGHARGRLPARLLAEEAAADPQRAPRLRLADRTRGPRRPGLRGRRAVAPGPARSRARRLDRPPRPVPGGGIPRPRPPRREIV